MIQQIQDIHLMLIQEILHRMIHMEILQLNIYKLELLIKQYLVLLDKIEIQVLLQFIQI